MFGCHGEYQTSFCLHVRAEIPQPPDKSYKISNTSGCAEYISSVSLFSAVFVVLPRSSLSPSHLSEGKNGFLLFCSFLHTLPHILCMNGTIFTPPVLPCSCLHSLLPPLSKGCAPAPLAKTPSHCKRMSLSQRKQSAFIMCYLPGPPWQRVMMPRRGESVFGVKVCGSEE